jgi:hypothetical protein
VPNGDRRQPHPDLAGLFDGTRSRYAYQVEGLLAEIIEAEQEFFDMVWYVRSISYDDTRELPADILTGMMAHRERIEAKYRRGELWKAIGPGHEEAWQYGYINGELATLRWVLGSEWDFLGT